MPVLALAEPTQKPPLHGRHWVAITGKPLGATAGAMMFQRGGNAVDAACAMLGATATMFDALSWGGETQALIYHPQEKRVIGVNALGVAPTGATPEFFHSRSMDYPPELGPLAAVTPGTPGGLMTLLAEYGTLSLADVLAPAIDMADGYPIEAQTANAIERAKEEIKQWPYSRDVLLPHLGEEREAPRAGEIFRQPDLKATLEKLVEAESEALRLGKSRKEAIYAAYDRFYRGDIAKEFVRGSREQGGLHTEQDLAGWKVEIEEPVSTSYKGIEVYKLTHWVQGPVLLQALNILEGIDLASMGYNSSRYIHALYQTMNLAFADRDFYYGDPYFPPEEPIRGLLSKDYASERRKLIDWKKNAPDIAPGDPYPFQGGTNPYREYLDHWGARHPTTEEEVEQFENGFFAGTTSIQAADDDGWVVSVTPSGGWIPATIAGKTGVGMSQRMQSFVLDEASNPFNVLVPGKRPRATLTPSLALKDGRPFLSFAVQGGDSQDQNLLQFFLNVVEFGMTVQEAAEAANFTSYQMKSSFGAHESEPGRLTLNESVSPWIREELRAMGYELDFGKRTSGPINAIFFDWEHGTMWGGSSNDGEDYGIAW
ncbi:MAG TPA: gamma-glutamyltransferase [Vicinamibacteria bacterium]|nr:gamma-glutamyltransferase [Vicinamibacteria bacterium]